MNKPHRLLTTGAAGLLLAIVHISASAASPPESRHGSGTDGVGAIPALQLDQPRSLDDIIPELADYPVVFVGEVHTRYDHHLIQLHIIESLAARDTRIAIGVEWFQQPFQGAIDRYIAGEIDERELLRETEYFRRWRYDFRHYAPILRYARQQRIPIIALNIPSEVISGVRDRGIDQLPPELRRWLPRTLDRSNTRYRQRLQEVFDAHPQTEFGDFERFHTVQLLWDEAMAERAAEYMDTNPDTQLIVLAGSGHLAYGHGIPARLERHTGKDAAIVLSQWEAGMDSRLADYLLLSQPRGLPPAGMLGVTIEPAGDDGVRLQAVSEDSAAARAGAEQGDLLVALDDTPIAEVADVRTVMWEKRPGDRVTMTLRRIAADDTDAVEELAVTLQ